MPKYLLIVLLFFESTIVFGQPGHFNDTVATYFNEIKTATAENENIWGYNLYAPILLVRPATREVYANSPDTAGLLKSDGTIHTCILPGTINIANTSIHWGGRDWAMVMLPLPDNEHERLNILAHELFHRAQPHLGFKLYNPDNNHLDQKEGRIYLRLELEALKAALLASSREEMKRHLANALSFRLYRHKSYHGADSTENLLELNEGIAEYTGVMLSGRNNEEMRTHFIRSIGSFLADNSYVRSFAYETLPVYGYLLSKTIRGWNKEISVKTNLTRYFVSGFSLGPLQDSRSVVDSLSNLYHGESIVAEETRRDGRIKKQIAEYKTKFLEQPHLDISLENMNMSFDYKVIMPLEDAGTVYPTIRITDNWGILTVTNGALMSPRWNKVSVSMPTQISGEITTGDGWRLELKPGFVVRKDSVNRNYILSRQ